MQSPPTASVSGRVAQRDLEFLLAFPIPGQTTISEKLRYLFAFFRTYHESLGDYAECRAEMARLLAPAVKVRQQREHELGLHSEVFTAIEQSIPALMAPLITHRPGREGEAAEQDLRAGEQQLVRETARLLERLLRLAITPKAPAYRPEILREELKSVLELTEILIPADPPHETTKSTSS